MCVSIRKEIRTDGNGDSVAKLRIDKTIGFTRWNPDTPFVQFPGILRTPIPAFAFLPHGSDYRFNPVCFHGPGRGLPFQPLIIPAFAHPNSLTHLLNGKSGVVHRYELKYFPSLLEKMLTAFFRMFRSISAFFNSFFNRAISRWSSVILALPFPEKRPDWNCSYSRLHRRSISELIPSSDATNPAVLPDKHKLTAISLNSLSKCLLSFFIIQ